jgi:hypothetical protein
MILQICIAKGGGAFIARGGEAQTITKACKGHYFGATGTIATAGGDSFKHIKKKNLASSGPSIGHTSKDLLIVATFRNFLSLPIDLIRTTHLITWDHFKNMAANPHSAFQDWKEITANRLHPAHPDAWQRSVAPVHIYHVS